MAHEKKNGSTDIFSYFDFRDFLRDLTTELKHQKKFNLRKFAVEAHIKAPGYLKMVIDGRRNLTPETAKKFCLALHLVGNEKKYFLSLVAYNQTTNPDLKKKYFERLLKFLPRSADFMREKMENRYFSRHYYACIREMVVLRDFREDYKWIAKRCFPKISPQQAKEAISTLLDLGLLRRDGQNRLVQTESFVHTTDKQNEVAETYHFHEAVLNKARHALGKLHQDERNYYALTLPLPLEMFDEIIRDFYDFRDRLLKKVEERAKSFDEVYQINFQLFPVTKKGSQDENTKP